MPLIFVLNICISAIAITGYAILIATKDNKARYAAVFLICAGIYPCA